MSELKRFTIDQQQKILIKEKIKKSLADKEDIIFAYVFGSFIDYLPFRDIDIGIYSNNFHKENQVNKEIEISLELEQLVQFPVDVHILNHAPLYFKFSVIHGELLLVKDEDYWADCVDIITRKYLDEKPLREQFLQEAFS